MRAVPAAENEGEWPHRKLVDAFPVQEKVCLPYLGCLETFKRWLSSLLLCQDAVHVVDPPLPH